MHATTNAPLDLEQFKDCVAYTVTERVGTIPKVQVGDTLIVKPGVDPKADEYFVVRAAGRLSVHKRLSTCEVSGALGVVVGLVRSFAASAAPGVGAGR